MDVGPQTSSQRLVTELVSTGTCGNSNFLCPQKLTDGTMGLKTIHRGWSSVLGTEGGPPLRGWACTEDAQLRATSATVKSTVLVLLGLRHCFWERGAKLSPTLCDPTDATRLAPLSLTISLSLPKFMSIELVMLSNHLILSERIKC